MVPEKETGSRSIFVQLSAFEQDDEFESCAMNIGRILTLISDLYLDRIVPIPSPDLITARMTYLHSQMLRIRLIDILLYNCCKSTARWTDGSIRI